MKGAVWVQSRGQGGSDKGHCGGNEGKVEV